MSPFFINDGVKNQNVPCFFETMSMVYNYIQYNLDIFVN